MSRSFVHGQTAWPFMPGAGKIALIDDFKELQSLI